MVSLILTIFSMLLSPSVKAAASGVKVLSYSWYVSPANSQLTMYPGYDFVVVGEVENMGSNVVGSVTLEGRAYNSSGVSLDWCVTQTRVPYILPGQKSPFYMDFPPENSMNNDWSWVPSVTNVTVDVNSVNATAPVVPYSGLATSGVTSSNSAGTFTVTGTVKNNGTQAVNNVLVATTFYNASGSVVGLNYTSNYLSNSFSPGNSMQFIATPADNTQQLSNSIKSYAVMVQSQPVTAIASPSPTPISSSKSSPTPSPTASPSNPQLLTAAILGVGIVIVVVIVLVALMLLRKRQNNAQFELPPPPP